MESQELIKSKLLQFAERLEAKLDRIISRFPEHLHGNFSEPMQAVADIRRAAHLETADVGALIELAFAAGKLFRELQNSVDIVERSLT